MNWVYRRCLWGWHWSFDLGPKKKVFSSPILTIAQNDPFLSQCSSPICHKCLWKTHCLSKSSLMPFQLLNTGGRTRIMLWQRQVGQSCPSERSKNGKHLWKFCNVIQVRHKVKLSFSWIYINYSLSSLIYKNLNLNVDWI